VSESGADGNQGSPRPGRRVRATYCRETPARVARFRRQNPVDVQPGAFHPGNTGKSQGNLQRRRVARAGEPCDGRGERAC